MAASTAQPMGSLPSGLGICTTAPDIFYLPELVFGGLVWILVASTHVDPPNPLGWVMFVSVFCFVLTFLWMIIFAAGGHKNSSAWAAADFAYHGLAAFFYLSAGVRLRGHAPLLHPRHPLRHPMEKLLKSDAEPVCPRSPAPPSCLLRFITKDFSPIVGHLIMFSEG
ncbi:myelin and lymphocyte protein-like isoform X1 [Trachinotus anak]|uniref:myelin and lymphocyte protein-like isoform X1 n=1 Tax=Trachinotus anak TaxID=443729 RepID=UPI0039F22FF3